MRPPSQADTQEKLLFLLKTRGAQSASQLAKRLQVTPVAVRQHLGKLSEDGLVEWSEEALGVGRPKRSWFLTAEARKRFPDTHADFALEFLEATREALGKEGLAKILESRAKRQVDQLLAKMPAPGGPLKDRVAALAADRRAAGYMAEWSGSEKSGFLLVENHCPICAAAQVCQGLCDKELELFQTALGPEAKVSREEHIIAGDRRCTYRIQPRD